MELNLKDIRMGSSDGKPSLLVRTPAWPGIFQDTRVVFTKSLDAPSGCGRYAKSDRLEDRDLTMKKNMEKTMKNMEKP